MRPRPRAHLLIKSKNAWVDLPVFRDKRDTPNLVVVLALFVLVKHHHDELVYLVDAVKFQRIRRNPIGDLRVFSRLGVLEPFKLHLLHSAQSTAGLSDPSPAGHRVQLLAPVLARVLVTDPAGQSVHDKAEILSRYVPLGHGSQWVRFDSVPSTHGAQTPVAGSWT